MEGKELIILNIYKYLQETKHVCPRPLNTYMHAGKNCTAFVKT